MKCAVSVVAVVLWLGPSVVVGQPVIQNTSLVRVRADNRFGVVKDSPPRTPQFPLAVTDTITDTEIGTAATATTSATYDITLTPAGARIGVERTDHSYSVGSHANLTEGFIQFTTTEPYVYEVTGVFAGASGDTADTFQLRAFVRQFQPPFATVYLEDELGSAPRCRWPSTASETAA